MLSLIRIAVRNVLRNTKRSVITMAAVIIGTAVIIFFRGFLNGLQKGLVEAVTNGVTGQVQIYKEGYLAATDAFPLHMAIDMNGGVKDVLTSDPRVTAYAGRLNFAGQLSNGSRQTLIVGLGIDPVKNYEVVPDAKADDFLLEGTALPPDREDAVIVPDKLADALDLSVGDAVTVVATTQAGGFDTMDFEVVGIWKTNAQITGYETKTIQMPLESAQILLGMEDQVTEIIAKTNSFDSIDPVTAALTTAAASRPELKLEVTNWERTGAFFVDIIDIQDMVLNIVTMVLLLVIITGIVNTMLMSVFERVREVGTMMAIGVRRNKILWMFMIESTVLGLLGAAIGLVIGVIVVQVLGTVGFEVTPRASPRAIQLFPFIRPEYLLFVLGLSMSSSILAAIYPAYQAARLRPVEALSAQ